MANAEMLVRIDQGVCAKTVDSSEMVRSQPRAGCRMGAQWPETSLKGVAGYLPMRNCRRALMPPDHGPVPGGRGVSSLPFDAGKGDSLDKELLRDNVQH